MPARTKACFHSFPVPLFASLLIATALGACMPLAFAPSAIWPLAILIPALLVGLLDRNMSAKRLFVHGWLFGNGYFGVGIYWTYNSLHDFGQAPPLVAATIAATLVMYLALFPALTLSAWQWARHRIGEKAFWLLPLWWFAFEWLKGWLLTGMPWLSLGYAFAESPLAGFAPLIGVYGISALSLLLSIALVRLIKHRQYGVSLWIVFIPALGLGLHNIEWTQPSGKALEVTIVQGNIPQDMKWRYELRQAIFDIYWSRTQKHWNSDLIVWPETALPGLSANINASILQPMAKIAAENDSHILTGVVVSEQAQQRHYNSMLLLGAQKGVYHKRHLVLFGEYYPLRQLLDFFSRWINIPYADLAAGADEQPLISVQDIQLGLSICFENVFSRDILRDLPDAHILVNASNDAWFGDSLAPHQHLQIAQMRALETGRPMVRSTNTGISAFIDAKGRILARSAAFKTQSLSQSVQGYSGITPFFYWAKIQGLVAMIILLTGTLYCRLHAKGSNQQVSR